MYKWDNTLFDGVVMPAGVDFEIIKNKILIELAELEVLYSNPNTLKFAITNWSKSQLDVFTRLYETINKKYDFLDTYRMEREGEEDYIDHLEKSKNSVYDTIRDESITKDTTNNSEIKELNKQVDAYNTVGQDINYVYGFNSADKVIRNSDESKYSDTGKTDADNKSTGKRVEKNVSGRDDRIKTTGNVGENNWQRGGTIKGELSVGNTGVYAPSELFLKEIDASYIEFDEIVVKDFKKNFCLQRW